MLMVLILVKVMIMMVAFMTNNREFKIPQRRRRQKRRLKSDFSIYETLAQLSQLGHYLLCRRTFLELSS